MPKKLNPRRHEEITRLRSAEELFKLIDNEKVLQDLGIRGVTWSRAEWDRRAMSAPYTPPSNILAARKTEVEYKGRDYEALTKAALKPPVGYWEDAPRGMKFTVTPVPLAEAKAKIASAAPTPSVISVVNVDRCVSVSIAWGECTAALKLNVETGEVSHV